MEWTFPVNGPLRADLELAAGVVEVDLRPTDEVRVELEALERDSDAAREQIASAYVACDHGRLEVRVPKRRRRDAPLRMQVLMPALSAAHVRTASADVSARGELAAFEAKTASGDVVAKDRSDTAAVQTASGDIRLGDVSGEVELQTASGDVVVGSVGGVATVSTASGDVRVASVSHDARLRTASGDVTVGCAYDGELSVNSVSGDVRIGVGSGVGTWLDLVTVSGDSRCTLMQEDEGDADAVLRVSCRTVSGDILVHSGANAVARPGQPGGDEGPGAGEGGTGAGGLGADRAGVGGPDGVPGLGEPPEGSGELPGGPGDLPGLGAGEGPGDSFPFGDSDPFEATDNLAPGIAGLSKLADLADLAGLADVADMVIGWSSAFGIRHSWAEGDTDT
jgi:DUF4097 and DUF4098 domain-containing protein YvlB